MVLEEKLFLSLHMERWSVSTSPRLLRGAQRDLGHGRQWLWGQLWGCTEQGSRRSLPWQRCSFVLTSFSRYTPLEETWPLSSPWVAVGGRTTPGVPP